MILEILKAYYNKLFYPKYPIGMTLYLNNICNLKCSFCEIGQRNKAKRISEKGASLSKEEIDKLINLCLRTKIKSIYVTGGEPFLSKNLWYLLEKCYKNKIIVEDITTNGTLLNRLEKQEINLLNNVVLNIIISIDSADERGHDKSRGVIGTFQKIRAFLLNERKRELYKSSFSFNVVVHSKNISELKHIADLSIPWAIKHINFQPISTETIFVDMEKIQNKEEYVKNFNINIFEKKIEQLFKYCNKRNVSTNLSIFKLWVLYYFKYLNSKKLFFNSFPPKFLCSKVFNYIHINYNGDFLPCTNLNSTVNINDENCFRKWQNNAQRLKMVFKRKRYFSKCRYCFCDFPANFRISLLYFPIRNINLLIKLVSYYLGRTTERQGSLDGSGNNYNL